MCSILLAALMLFSRYIFSTYNNRLGRCDLFSIAQNKSHPIEYKLKCFFAAQSTYNSSVARSIEQGTHQELLGKCGKYAEMWKHQSGEFIS
jgi:hypothetical protein